VVPLAVAAAALVGVLSIGAAAWLLPMLGLAAWALVHRVGAAGHFSWPASPPRW
jgi:hypothetical protein